MESSRASSAWQSDNKTVAGATVRAFNAGTGYERSVASDESGRYTIPLLPPGEYVVFVEAPGLAAMSRTGIALRAGQVLTVESSLPSSSFSESIEVTAVQSSVEVGRTVQSNTYDERTVRAVPTIGRSILDFFVLQPGVNAPPISSGGSGTGTPSTVGPSEQARGSVGVIRMTQIAPTLASILDVVLSPAAARPLDLTKAGTSRDK